MGFSWFFTLEIEDGIQIGLWIHCVYLFLFFKIQIGVTSWAKLSTSVIISGHHDNCWILLAVQVKSSYHQMPSGRPSWP